MVLPQLQPPGWTCRTKVSPQRGTLSLSLGKSFGEYFRSKAGRLNAMIGWISSLVNTRFSSTPPFHSTRNNRHTTQPLRRISGYCRPGHFTEAFWESKMGTQYTTDIPFSSSHHQQALKLLELPPELLALLEPDNPPMCVHPLLLPSTRLKYSAD
jgi:hypothetical protein